MKSLVALMEALLRDASDLYSLDPTRDLKTITRRHVEEGEPFLAITLDAYRVAFEAALESGTWDTIVIPGFRKDGRLPAFLRGFVSLVFQRNGQIRQKPDERAVEVIRQLTGFAAKQEVDCNPRYQQKAVKDFILTDSTAVSRASAELKAVFSSMFDGVLQDVRKDIESHNLPVKHGTGGSQDKLLPNSRWKFAHWEERLDDFFPSYLYTRVNDSHIINAPDVDYATEAVPVRVQLVPKTAKGPRIIAVEPSWRMYVQQGLMGSLVRAIERRGLPPQFSSSAKNQKLAYNGSVNGSVATIDLSSASDSVSAALVADLFSGRPYVRDALFACRSTQAELPDGTTLTLNKFASMGSATCFPVEAMVFSAIAVLAIAPRDEKGFVVLPVPQETVRRVTVYGDDIIVPNDRYNDVTAHLELFGFKVNVKKSFHQGSFRESCGSDYFNGRDVRYVKVRRPLNYSAVMDVRDTVSTVSLRNQLAERGIWPRTVRALDRSMLDGLKLFPYGTAESTGLVRVGGLYGEPVPPTVGRTSTRLWRAEQRAWTVKAESKIDPLDGYEGVHKSLRLAERRTGPYSPLDFERAGRAARVRLTAQWLPSGS